MSRYIDMNRGCFGVEPICRTLDVSASAYYHRKTGSRSARVVADERLLGLIEATHIKNYCAYGYRKMWLALGRAGHQVGRDHVKRLMRAHGIQGAKRAGSRGAPRPRTHRRHGRLIWSTVTSPPRGLTSCGSRTSSATRRCKG